MAFILKLKSQYSFVDAVTDWGRMDGELWRRVAVESHGIDILLAPESPSSKTPDPRQWSEMIAHWRQMYDAVVIDNPGPGNPLSLVLAAICDRLLVITTNELAALHSTRKTLLHLDQNGVDPAAVKLIVNRRTAGKGLPEATLETALNRKVFHQLPNDYEALQRALLEGKPAQGNTEFAKSIGKLAQRMTGFTGAARELKKASGFWNKG